MIPVRLHMFFSDGYSMWFDFSKADSKKIMKGESVIIEFKGYKVTNDTLEMEFIRKKT